VINALGLENYNSLRGKHDGKVYFGTSPDLIPQD